MHDPCPQPLSRNPPCGGQPLPFPTVIQVADERNKPPARARAPFLLHGASTTCRVQQWSYRADTAQLVLYHQRAMPSAADLTQWCRELAALGYHHVRTSAVAGVVAAALESAGFTVFQQLALLEHTDVRRASRTLGEVAATTRLLAGQRAAASRIDTAAFGREWALDQVALHEVCAATPRHHARGVGEPLAGYAITGRDGRQGFLQRLAVHPDAQRQGLGLALVADSLAWMARWRVVRALVNTPTDNEGALDLYRRVGYRRLPELLYVYERSLS